MKKNIEIKFILLIVASLFFSCETTDEVNLKRNEKPGVSIQHTSIDVPEGGSNTITIETETAATKDMIFKLVQTGGDAVLGVDYDFAETSNLKDGEIGGRIFIPAYTFTGSVDIIGLKNYTPSDKSAVFELRSIESMIGIPAGNKQISVNFIAGNKLDILLDWSGTYTGFDGNEHDWCDYDLDLELYDASFNLLNASYTNCPEGITISPGDYQDGDYWIVPEFWDVGTAPENTIQIPVHLFFGKAGVGATTVDLSSFWDTDTGGYIQGNPYWYAFKYILTISGSTYTITDIDTNTVLFQM